MVEHEAHVRLLGAFKVVVDGTPVADGAWRRRRAAALVKLLALAPNRRVPRDEAIDALWPDFDAAAGGRNLRKAAHHARQALGVRDAIVLDGKTVALLPAGRVTTDVDEFVTEARAAVGDGDEAACRKAAVRYGGELLPEDRFEPWSHAAREQTARLYVQVLEGGRLWGRLLSLEPTSEVAHRAIIRERMEAGDRAGAIRQFARLRTVLREELGVSPDPESVALYEQVLAAEGSDVATPAERARALLAWGMVHWERSDVAETERAAREARALAIDAGLGREMAEASELLGLVGFAQGRWREVFAEGFLDAIDRNPELAPFVYDANLCMSEFALHEPDGLAELDAFADDLLERAGFERPAVRAVALLLRGEVGLYRGWDLKRVAAVLSEARHLHRAAGAVSGEALAACRLGEIESIRGDLDAATTAWASARSAAVETPLGGHLLPLIFGTMIEPDQPDRATALLDEAEEELRSVRTCDPCSMTLLVRGAIACANVEQLDRAKALLDQATRIAQRWRGGPWQAALAEARGALARTTGADADTVAALFEQARVGFEQSGRPRDAARCARLATTRS